MKSFLLSAVATAKLSAAGARAMMAVAVVGPTPGMVISRRTTGSAFARRPIPRCKAVI